MNRPTLAHFLNSHGRRVYFDPSDGRGLELSKRAGAMFPESVTLWEHALRFRDSWDLILDVGANYGEMLVDVECLRAERIVAFEPNPAIAPLLARTLDESDLPVEIVCAAVGSADGEVCLEVNRQWSGTSHVSDASFVTSPETEGVTVPVVSLDSFLGASSPTTACVKIDVEGFEQQVLAGAAATLESAELVVIMVEILHMPVEEVFALSRKWPMLLLSTDDAKLVHWDGRWSRELGQDLHSGDYHRQDALFLAGVGRNRFMDGISASTASSTTLKIHARRTAERAREREATAHLENIAAERRAKNEALERIRSERLRFTDDMRAERKAKNEALARLRSERHRFTEELRAERKAKNDALAQLNLQRQKKADEQSRVELQQAALTAFLTGVLADERIPIRHRQHIRDSAVADLASLGIAESTARVPHRAGMASRFRGTMARITSGVAHRLKRRPTGHSRPE